MKRGVGFEQAGDVLVVAVARRAPSAKAWAPVLEAAQRLIDDPAQHPHARVLVVTDGAAPKMASAPSLASERRIPQAVIGAATEAPFLPEGWVTTKHFDRGAIDEALSWLQIDPSRGQDIVTLLPGLAESAEAWECARAVLGRLRARIEAASPEGRVALERARVAEQLERELGPRLAELRTSLERFGEHSATGTLPLAGLSDRVARAREELGGIVWAMEEGARPWPAVAAYVGERLTELAGSRCELRVEEADDVMVDGQTALHLLRIVQEAVRNALTHADAARITVTLGCAENAITASIADDGRGIDATALANQHGGLHNIRARAAASGGAAEVATSAAGTRWDVRLAL